MERSVGVVYELITYLEWLGLSSALIKLIQVWNMRVNTFSFSFLGELSHSFQSLTINDKAYSTY